MKIYTVRIRGRTAKSAENTARRYGRIPIKTKLMKSYKKINGMNLYSIKYHLKK